MRAVIGNDADFNPRFVDKRGKDGKFSILSKTKVTVPKNVTTIQYLIWGYGVSYATFKRWKTEDFKWIKHVPAHTGTSVLTNAVFARSIYKPRRMYLDAEMAVWYERQRMQSRRVDARAKKDHRDCLKKQWRNLKKDERVPYEKLSRDHDARQPLMKECLVEALLPLPLLAIYIHTALNICANFIQLTAKVMAHATVGYAIALRVRLSMKAKASS
jgi:hypothetical protein